jgi:hypothetical protein
MEEQLASCEIPIYLNPPYLGLHCLYIGLFAINCSPRKPTQDLLVENPTRAYLVSPQMYSRARSLYICSAYLNGLMQIQSYPRCAVQYKYNTVRCTSLYSPFS